MRSTVLLLLALLLTLASCGGQIDTAPRPASTADVTRIQLVPYQDKESGLDGVVPQGWFEALPGIFLAGVLPDRPDTALIQRLEAGATLDQVAVVWKELLGKRKISHLTNNEIARLADAAAGTFCYTVGVGAGLSRSHAMACKCDPVSC